MTDLTWVPRYGNWAVLVLACGHALLVVPDHGKWARGIWVRGISAGYVSFKCPAGCGRLRATDLIMRRRPWLA